MGRGYLGASLGMEAKNEKSTVQEQSSPDKEFSSPRYSIEKACLVQQQC